jgi:LmbE family N-acetylglucosaminyl deacetylase
VTARQLLRHVVISTHFDDAVLSVSHLLQRARSNATVVTVCGGVPPMDTPAEWWDRCSGFDTGDQAARARALEDARACALTGANHRALDHLDRPYRDGEPLDVRILRDAVEASAAKEAVLWLPVGICHADHVEVREALLPLAELRPELTGFYADLPYASPDKFDLPPALAESFANLRCERIELAPASFALKCESVELHASQIGPLTADEAWPSLLEPTGPLRCECFWTNRPLADLVPQGILQR